MNFQDLKKNLDELKPVYLIKGSDAFLRSKATEMLINHAVTLKDLNCSIFTDENTDMSAILSACRSIPMLDTKKVVVLRDINIKKVDDIKPLLEYVQKPLASTILIIVDSRNVTTYKKIEPYCELIDCSPLDSDMLAKLVATQLKSYGCAINKDALQKLVEYCNADYTRINNETIKLGNLLGQGGVVTTQIIEENIHREVEYDIFELGNYAAQKNGQKAMEIINHLLERKESPQMLLIMVLNNFIEVTKNRREELVLKYGLYGIYVCVRTIQNNAAITLNELSQILRNKSGFDTFIKLVISHFGDRAQLLKAQRGIIQILDAINKDRGNANSQEQLNILDTLYTKIASIENDLHELKEWNLLLKIYENSVTVDNDFMKEFLVISGESGHSAVNKLGVNEDADISEMIALAIERKKYWKAKYNAWYGLSQIKAEPYAVIAKSYELLSIRLREQKEKYEKAIREIRIYNHYIYGKDSL